MFVVDPSTPETVGIATARLTYEKRRSLHGEERRRASSPIEVTTCSAYCFDHRDRLATSIGMYHRLQTAYEAAGYTVTMNDIAPPANPEALEPNWDVLFDPSHGLTLAETQDQFIAVAAAQIQARLPGVFNCAPGYGKSRMLTMLCLLFPKARIHIIAKSIAVLRDRLYPELSMYLPRVGIVGGGRRVKGHRIQLYGVDALHNSDGKADIVLADECHDFGAERASERMAIYDSSVNLGFSATPFSRSDGTNMTVEAIFGPEVFNIDYSKAVEIGRVVPLTVQWHDVILPGDVDPCEFVRADRDDLWKRAAYWQNTHRNSVIASVARGYDDDTQVLITCATLEHALFIQRQLPDFELIYAEHGFTGPQGRRQYNNFMSWGIITPDFVPMNTERRMAMTSMFEQGRLKKVIATTVFNVGVSFNALQVLIRADGGTTEIANTQIPGRVSRTLTDGTKTDGYVHDFCDQFNARAHRRAVARFTDYKQQNWTQQNFKRMVKHDRDSTPSDKHSGQGPQRGRAVGRAAYVQRLPPAGDG